MKGVSVVLDKMPTRLLLRMSCVRVLKVARYNLLIFYARITAKAG